MSSGRLLLILIEVADDINVARLTSAHTADYLAERLVSCFREYGIEAKVWTTGVFYYLVNKH